MGNNLYENIFFVLGGLAVLMYGMKIMGVNLENAAGSKMKKVLGKMTSNRFAGVGVGALTTAIIQSSSATTVMLVGLVNIGMLNLLQATSVSRGANIGTTITAPLFGFNNIGSVNVTAIVMLITTAGMVMGMFLKGNKVNCIGYILVGLGLIFLGLEVMSVSLKAVVYLEDGSLSPFFAKLFEQDASNPLMPLLALLIGLVMTSIIQSSSAMTGILISFSGAMPFRMAMFMILGSNIGTCVTALLSSIGTNANARRTAVIHLLFNCFGALLFLAPLWIWQHQIEDFIVLISGENVSRQIANFHTLFKILIVAVFLPFINLLVKLSMKIVPDKKRRKEEKEQKALLDDRLLETPPVAVSQAKSTIVDMANLARKNMNLASEILLDGNFDRAEEIKKNEERLNFMNRTITEFLTKIMSVQLSGRDERSVATYYHVVSDLERVGDYAENIMEYGYKMKNGGMEFSADAVSELKDMLSRLNRLFELTMKSFAERDRSVLTEADQVEESIDESQRLLEDRHIERVKAGQCSANIRSVYLQTLSDYERIGDHLTNVAFSINKI